MKWSKNSNFSKLRGIKCHVEYNNVDPTRQSPRINKIVIEQNEGSEKFNFYVYTFNTKKVQDFFERTKENLLSSVVEREHCDFIGISSISQFNKLMSNLNSPSVFKGAIDNQFQSELLQELKFIYTDKEIKKQVFKLFDQENIRPEKEIGIITNKKLK